MARHNYKKRTLALALAGLMAATCVVPAGAVPIQDGVAPPVTRPITLPWTTMATCWMAVW